MCNRKCFNVKIYKIVDLDGFFKVSHRMSPSFSAGCGKWIGPVLQTVWMKNLQQFYKKCQKSSVFQILFLGLFSGLIYGTRPVKISDKQWRNKALDIGSAQKINSSVKCSKVLLFSDFLKNLVVPGHSGTPPSYATECKQIS